jgi:hypothetical protein
MVQVQQQKEIGEKMKKHEEEEFKLQEMVRMQDARMTAEHENQIRLLKQKYAQDLQDQIEYNNTLKVGTNLTHIFVSVFGLVCFL